MGYMCYYHPNLPASMVCLRCGRRICTSCSKPYGELALCPTCYHATVMNQPAVMHPPQAPVASMGAQMGAPMGAPALYAQGVPQGIPPPAGVAFGPPPRLHFFRRYSLLAVAFLIISAGLIIANAAALLWPSFFLFWIAWFPWVAQLGNFSFILGVVLGMVILGAVILYMLGFRVLSAFMVFPAAIVSLFIGGGFVLGLVLGVLTGIFMIMNEKYYR